METDKKDWNLLYTAMYFGLLSLITILVSCFFVLNKSVVITQAAEEKEEKIEEESYQRRASLKNATDERIHIRLKSAMDAGSILLENKYRLGQIWVHLKNCDSTQLEETIELPREDFANATFEYSNSETIIKIEATDTYEYKSVLDGNQLLITYGQAADLYEMFVVMQVDPQYPYLAELSKQMEKEEKTLLDKGIRISFASGQDQVEDIERMKPDFLVHLTVSQSEDAEKYGIDVYYQGDYYSERLPVTGLSDCFAKTIAVSCVNRANGLYVGKEEMELTKYSFPAILVSLGYDSNPQEASLLAREDYNKKIASGLIQAVLEVYGRYYED